MLNECHASSDSYDVMATHKLAYIDYYLLPVSHSPLLEYSDGKGRSEGSMLTKTSKIWKLVIRMVLCICSSCCT